MSRLNTPQRRLMHYCKCVSDYTRAQDLFEAPDICGDCGHYVRPRGQASGPRIVIDNEPELRPGSIGESLSKIQP